MSAPLKVTIPKKAFLPCYHHLLEPNDFDIEFLWGGRDSGKSGHIARQLLVDCMRLPYFRCILIKKTFESIRDAQWQTLKDVAHDWGIDHLFDFKSSPLEIVCRINGNKFIARGCDKPEKVKSIANPSHAWFEEGNQLTQEDYVVIDTTLRSNKGKVKKYFSFNPECEGQYEDFWLFKTYFQEHYQRGSFSFSSSLTQRLDDDTVVEVRYRSTRTTYHNNPYVTPERKANLETLKTTSPYYYQVFTLGMWGAREVKSPFATQFDEAKHVSLEPEYDPLKELIISLDFNIDPFAFSFWHDWKDKDGEHLHCFDERTIYNASIQDAIDYIKLKYPRSLPTCKVTGDRNGNNKQMGLKDNASLYMQLMRGLKLRPSQIIILPNPTHKNSRADCNYLLMHHPDIKIHRDRCPNMRFDLRYVEVDAEGAIIKAQRKDEKQRADHLDNFRYLVHTFKRPWILKHQKLAK